MYRKSQKKFEQKMEATEKTLDYDDVVSMGAKRNIERENEIKEV